MRGRQKHAPENRKEAERKPELKPFAGRAGGQDRSFSSILDEDHHAMEKRNVEDAINAKTSRERVIATQEVVTTDAIWKVFKNSPHVDSKELARYKLRGLDFDV